MRDLEAVAGINRATARAVYAYFHPGVKLEEC
jgi:excinuclease ABC subunit C